MDGAGWGFWLIIAAFLLAFALFFYSVAAKCWRDFRARRNQGYEPIV